MHGINWARAQRIRIPHAAVAIMPVTPNAIMRARMALPLEDAVAEKFAAGRACHGPVWQGDRPLVEAHDDALDVLAYLEEEIRQNGASLGVLGAREWVQIAIGAICNAAECIRGEME